MAATAERPGLFDASFRILGETLAIQSVSPVFGLCTDSPLRVQTLGSGSSSRQRPGDVVASLLPGAGVPRIVHAGSFGDQGSSWERLRVWLPSMLSSVSKAS